MNLKNLCLLNFFNFHTCETTTPFTLNTLKTMTRSLLKSLLFHAKCDILALYNERIFKQNKL